MTSSHEHRAAPRLLSGLKTEFRRVATSTGLTGGARTGRLVNVSATGLQLALPDPVLRGERLRIRPAWPGAAPDPADVDVYVVWSRMESTSATDRYTCGAEFDPPAQSGARWVLHQHRGRAAA